MDEQRRSFLKKTGAAGVAALAAGASVPERSLAQGAGPGASPGSPAAPKRMTFVTLRSGDAYSLGVKTDLGILDVAKTAKFFVRSPAPTTIDDLIRRGDRGLTELVKVALARRTSEFFVAEDRAELGPCVTNPEKILCVGLNYARHARETNNPIPKLPILFNKFNNALNCHGGTVRVSSIPAEKFDYESELVIVMGRKARNISEAEALSYVFGYCNGNDFTARDLQSRSSQWMIGKTCDGFGLLGPYLVTADQIPDPNNLKIEGTVNGEVRQSSNTSDMVFNCAQIVSYASTLMTLSPGDVIYTGTPEGVISGYPKEKQVWLKAGDRLTTTIERLGTLRFALV
jgi:2-keto-4-pentenoate hydratase/2-oxohepta-3-ene-1,7-dioic acid hydratase in catechol pathway